MFLANSSSGKRERGEEGDDGGGFEVQSVSAAATAASRSPTCICNFLRFEVPLYRPLYPFLVQEILKYEPDLKKRSLRVRGLGAEQKPLLCKQGGSSFS